MNEPGDVVVDPGGDVVDPGGGGPAGAADVGEDAADPGATDSGAADSDATDPGALGRGRRVVLGVVAGAALVAVGGLLATVLVKSPAQVAAETGPPAQGLLTAEVERRVLAQTVVTRGTVVADQSVDVAPSRAPARAPARPS